LKLLYIQYTNPAGYPPLGHGSRILAERGWQVLFLGTGAHGAGALEFPAHPNIEVRRSKFQQRGLWQKLHFLAFDFWTLMTAIFWKPKWIYASDHFMCPVALLLKRMGFRVLYHEHDSPNNEVGSRKAKVENGSRRTSAFQRFLLWTRIRLARRADLCVLPNDKRVELFKQQTATSHPVICVWNCASRDEAEVRPEKSPDEFIVFYHGSLTPSRLPLQVIDALAKLPKFVRFEFAGYETVGHSCFASRLLQRAAERGVDHRVKYLGPIPQRPDLIRACRRAHVGLSLMPTNTNDFNEATMTGASNKPFDYMACALALLVSDLPDWNAMFVDPDYARACNPEDRESIASALRWFFEHPDETRAMGDRGRERVVQNWNYEAQFEPVLRRLESA
jgi:glycosyltransferase involved in cell wall biosynthesis